jgi:hypothetical protein
MFVISRCVAMVDRLAKLEAALRLSSALCVRAERLIAAYIAPESNRPAIIEELVRLFDGTPQREAAKRLAAEALGENPDRIKLPLGRVSCSLKASSAARRAVPPRFLMRPFAVFRPP